MHGPVVSPDANSADSLIAQGLLVDNLPNLMMKTQTSGVLVHDLRAVPMKRDKSNRPGR